MRVLTCLAFEHDWRLVLLAVAMCIAGAWVSTLLIYRALTERGASRYHWIFLASVTAGSSIWATHFIAMLAYQVAVPVTFDVTLTILSALVAVLGIALGLVITSLHRGLASRIAGGGTVGLAVAAMHYLGMLAYRAEGVVSWLPSYVIASLVLSTALGMIFIDQVRRNVRSRRMLVPCTVLVLAIVALHFTGMAAFQVTPLPGMKAGMDPEVFLSMASSIALVAVLILGASLSTNLVERRTYSESQTELEHIAMHDALTGLANRHAFASALENQCDHLAESRRPFALLMIDLDRFKPVNDMLGHPTGDIVLKKVAERLRHAVRGGDLVARMGGDEFAVILRDIADLEQVTAIADRIVEVLRRPILVHGNVAELGGSVGIALAPEHGRKAEQLIQHADIALYSAKHGGRERHSLFDPQLMERVKNRRQLETDLRRACMRDDFEIYYQPVIDSRTRAITGAEALLRWNCEGRGNVPPSEFIPLAEELGLVSRIGARVLRDACHDAAGWPNELGVAINISPVQLLDPRLPQMVSQALEDSGLPAERLELEITETALLGNDEVAFRTLTRLRELGVGISLDDFGTGYSSLSYLHRFPINRIKIDQSFVKLLPDDEGSVSIVRAIAQLGESLKLQITAEGIETEAQFDFIAEHGCGHVQGFLISRPVCASEFSALVGGTPGVTAAA